MGYRKNPKTIQIENPNVSDLSAKLAQIAYNVTAFGAKGDGIIDDTTAIQSAIDYANANGGGIVLLPKGSYKTTRKLIVYSKIALKGAGRGKTFLKGYGTGFSVIDSHGTKDAPIYDFELSDMTIDGTNLVDASYQTGTKCVYMSYLVRATFRNLHVYNSPATGLGVDFLQDSLIENVIAEKCGRQFNGSVGSNGIGIGTGLLSDKETLMIVNCHAINNGNNGIMFENQDNLTGYVYSGYAQVLNCTSRGNRIGFRNSGNMRMLFMGNHAISNTESGFMFSSGVSADMFANPNLTQAKETTLLGNFIINNGTEGIYLYQLHPDGAFNISRNFISGNTKNGIYHHYSYQLNNTKIEENIVKDNGTNGIAITGISNDVDIKNNKVFNNGSHGIYIAEAPVSLDVKENHVYKCGLNGIYFNKGGTKISVEGNKTNNNGQKGDTVNNDRDGIKFYANNVTFTETVVKNNKSFDNQATKTQRNGLTMGIGGTGSFSDVKIKRNDLRNNANVALSISSNNTFVIDDNEGYNPIGISAPSVGTSPYTYTAGNTKETVYISGGTVSSVVKGSITLYTSTNCSVLLMPNESIVVTYTVAPYIYAQRH